MLLEAMPVAYTPNLDQESVCNFDVTPTFTVAECRTTTFNQSHISHQTSSVVLITQVWPYHIIEDVILESLDRAW